MNSLDIGALLPLITTLAGFDQLSLNIFGSISGSLGLPVEDAAA